MTKHDPLVVPATGVTLPVVYPTVRPSVTLCFYWRQLRSTEHWFVYQKGYDCDHLDSSRHTDRSLSSIASKNSLRGIIFRCTGYRTAGSTSFLYHIYVSLAYSQNLWVFGRYKQSSLSFIYTSNFIYKEESCIAARGLISHLQLLSIRYISLSYHFDLLYYKWLRVVYQYIRLRVKEKKERDRTQSYDKIPYTNRKL